jgi:hypothetical protein
MDALSGLAWVVGIGLVLVLVGALGLAGLAARLIMRYQSHLSQALEFVLRASSGSAEAYAARALADSAAAGRTGRAGRPEMAPPIIEQPPADPMELASAALSREAGLP